MRLVDTASEPITAITPTGVRVGEATYELDVLIFATGFDAMTGTLTNIDIIGRDGITLRDKWARDGLRSNLGIGVNGFPNFFMSLGPQTPYSNLVVPIQLGAQWLQRALRWARDNGVDVFEATPESEEWWAEETERTGKATVMYTEGKKAKAWFLGDERAGQAGGVPGLHGRRSGLPAPLPRAGGVRLRVDARHEPGCATGEFVVRRSARRGDRLLHAPGRQYVGQLVVGDTRVALHPEPLDLVPRAGRLEPLPEVDVLHRLLRRGHPAVALPAEHPLGDAAADVGAVGVEVHHHRSGERLQRHDRRGQLHPVVAGLAGLATAHLADVLTLAQHRPPSAGPGVGFASAVGVDDHDVFGGLDGLAHAPRIGTAVEWLAQRLAGAEINAVRTDIPNS